MVRNIFIVDAQIVDSNGTFNRLNGYPKVFDSHSYNDNVDRALLRARGAFHTCVGDMCAVDTRQLQTVTLTSADGFMLERENIGAIADLPDPEPEPEE